MPSIQNTLYRLEEAHKYDNLGNARAAFHDWQACNCLHPQKISIYDAHSQKMRDIVTPCGKCYHCRESKVNEWVTRMYAHLEDFKHVYFVTLTYRSFTTFRQPELLMLQKLSQACWHIDDYNTYHKKCYRPCLLVKKHYQNFIKRLRKNTGYKDITYVLSGEYGKKYGSPHFHAILFSNNEITRADIVRAWSVCLWRNNDGSFEQRRNQKHYGQAYDFPIGRVDFNDLVTNGTLNTAIKVKIDGQMYGAAQCFAYVCKYVCKNESPNKWRINIAFHNLISKLHFTRIYKSQAAFNIAIEETKTRGYRIIEKCENNFNTNYNYLLRYEKNYYHPSCDVIAVYLSNEAKKLVYGSLVSTSFYPEKYFDFVAEFAPFVEFSRGTPIGSVYAANHLQEFNEGVFKRPLLQTKGFVIPRYFRIKAQNSRYGFRKVTRTLSGKSAILGGLVDLQRLLRGEPTPSGSQLSILPRWRSSQTYDSCLRKGDYCYRDLSTGENIIMSAGRALHFRYDRHTKKYRLTKYPPIKEFLSHWLERLSDEITQYRTRIDAVRKNVKYLEYTQLLALDLGLEWNDLRDDFESSQTKYLIQKQIEYDQFHISVDE